MNSRMNLKLTFRLAPAAALLALAGPVLAAKGPDAAFTVANYPVDATAQNAVAAKEKAIADGQQAAFRSLLKRLVPVTSFNKLGQLKSLSATNLVDGVAVRAERNSTTQYIATLDFSFHPGSVRDLLRRQGIPFVDKQAPEVVIVPVYVAPAAGGPAVPTALGAAEGARAWRDAWKSLDLDNALAPVKLEAVKGGLNAEAIRAAQSSAEGARRLAGEVRGDLGLVAIAEPELASRRLHVTLSGADAVGAFVLKRTYQFDAGDFAYTAELAALVALGTLEGRWKAARVGTGAGMATALDQPLRPVQMFVEYRTMQEWQDLRRRIAETTGVDDLQIGGVSARGADLALRFPGGGEALASALAEEGIELRNSGGTWVARGRN